MVIIKATIVSVSILSPQLSQVLLNKYHLNVTSNLENNKNELIE
jgi:hypothetical protein